MTRPLALLLCVAVGLPAFPPAVLAQQAPAVGLRYWLPVDVIVFDVTVVTTRTTDYVVTLVEGAGKLQKQTTSQVTREGQLVTRTLPDHDDTTPRTLDAVAGKLADTGLVVQVSPAGLLQSVNPTSRGRGGELLTSVAKFVGIAASVATGVPFGLLSLSDASKRHLSANMATPRSARSSAESAPKPEPPPDVCDPFAAPISTQPIRVRALLSKSERACEVFWHIQQRLDALEEFEGHRLRLQGQLDTAKPDEMPKLRGEIRDRTGDINNLNVELAAWQARLVALLEAFVANEGLGVTSRSERFSTTFRLADLKGSVNGLSNAQKDFFATSGVVVLGQPVNGPIKPTDTQIPPTKPAGPPKDETPKQRKEREKLQREAEKRAERERSAARDAVTIAFRQSRPWQLEVRASVCGLLAPVDDSGLKEPCRSGDKPVDPTIRNTELRNTQIADLIAGDTPPSTLTFTSASFADKGLSIVFDEKGRPTQLQRSGSSAAAGFTLAVADATARVQDEYAKGLAKVVEIQESRQKLALSGVNSEIARLQKEKELIDARLKASSAGQSFEVLLHQNQLNAELALLKTKLDSETAEKAYGDSLQLELLKAQLEKLKTELEVIKTQMFVDQAKPSGGS